MFGVILLCVFCSDEDENKMIIRKLTPCLGAMSGIHVAVHVTHKATSKLIKTLISKLISQSVLRCKMF